MGMTTKNANIEQLSDREYRCGNCGASWNPYDGKSRHALGHIPPTRHLFGNRPAGWWRCPNGCNVESGVTA